MPESRLAAPFAATVPAGYRLRTYRFFDDDTAFIALLNAAGFESWTQETLANARQKALPNGIFVAEHIEDGSLVATAMATHNPSDLHPFGGELGWVGTDPAHRGLGLGTAVCAAATERFRLAGYRRIYIKTDDWRVPAIRIYFNLGYVPFLFAPGMAERWRAVCEQAGRPFAPEQWPRIDT